MTVRAAVEAITKGSLSAEQLVTEHLEKAKTVGKELNAFITITDERALEKARAIDIKIQKKQPVGKLAGIPFTVKDVIMTEGIQTTASSRILEGFIAPYTATAIARLEAEDAIIIGKTNSDPFAFGGSGEHSGYGPTLNPHDHSRVPGGSSSGAAASLAAEIGLFAIGTDTGGSVRQPAAFCGLVGFKPTYGRNSRYGLISMASSFDTVGIFTHDILDNALIESIIAGHDDNDATTYTQAPEDYVIKAQEKLSLKDLRVGVPAEFFNDSLNKEVRQAVEATLDALKKADATIVPLNLPLLDQGISTYYVLVPAEISSNMARYDGVRYGAQVTDDYLSNLFQSRGEKLEAEVKRRIMLGTYVLSSGYADQYYKTAAKIRRMLIDQVEEAFKKVDVLVGPSTPGPAFKLGEKVDDPLALYLEDVYTVIANLIGCPAISVPIGKTKNNLPIGFQLMTPRLTESRLYQISYALEQLS